MDTVSILKALGEPMRFKIFQCLLERKHCVRSLSKKLSITESAISQHLKVMREAGLVYGKRFSYHIHYFPNQEAVDFLAKVFLDIQDKSKNMDRDTTFCNCEFRKLNTEEKG